MGYLIKVILTGLVIAAMPPNEDPQRVLALALALDDEAHHQAMLILMEGTCEPEEGHECHRLAADDPAGLVERFGLAWNLEQPGMKHLELRLEGPPPGIERHEVGGTLGDLPRAGQQTDLRWSPSLAARAKASGGADSTLREQCYREPPERCKLAVRLEVPFGEVASCHLVHFTDLTPPEEDVCDFVRDREQGKAAVLRHEFVTTSGGARGDAQAVADAVSVDYASAEAIPLRLNVGPDREHAVTLHPDPHTGRLVLLLMNQPMGPPLEDVDPRRRMVTRHPHFDDFYDVLVGPPPPEARIAPKVPHLQTSQRVTIGPGPCEPYFECLSYVFGSVHRLESEDFERTAVLPLVPMMPHNPSQCDVPTYP